MPLCTLRLPLALAVALALSPCANAEIFKCIGHRGVPTYQNFPCEFDSLDAANLQPALTRPPSIGAAAPSVAAAGRFASVAQRHAKARPTQSAIPRVGMTGDEVRQIWGEPTFMTTEEHAKKDIETWSYPRSRSIEFDREQRVTAIHW